MMSTIAQHVTKNINVTRHEKSMCFIRTWEKERMHLKERIEDFEIQSYNKPMFEKMLKFIFLDILKTALP